MTEALDIRRFSDLEKRRQAYTLSVRGNSVGTVAKILGVSVATVREWIDAFKHEIQGTTAQLNCEDYAMVLMDRIDQIRQETWSHYTKAPNDASKRQWLRMALDVEMKEKSAMLDLGLLSKPSVRHEHTVNIGINKGEIRPEQLDALAAMALSGELGVTPEEAIIMGGRSSPVLSAKFIESLQGDYNESGESDTEEDDKNEF